MRRFVPFLFVAALATGCGGGRADVAFTSPTPAPTTETSSTVDPTPTPQETRLSTEELAYLEALGNKPDADGSITFDSGLIEEGRLLCGEGEESYGPPSLDGIIESDQANDPEYAAALKHLCPKYLPILKKAKGGFTDGTYEVGKDIKAGTYRTTHSASDCYWERSTGGGDTIANDFVSNAPRGVRVTIYKDEGFKSQGCGNWQRA